MIKLVISFDEFEGVLGHLDPHLDAACQAMEAYNDWLCDYLENQFPDWDIELAFDFNNAEWDFDNTEVHIPMIVQ
jgi:hypothetical protein